MMDEMLFFIECCYNANTNDQNPSVIICFTITMISCKATSSTLTKLCTPLGRTHWHWISINFLNINNIALPVTFLIWNSSANTFDAKYLVYIFRIRWKSLDVKFVVGNIASIWENFSAGPQTLFDVMCCILWLGAVKVITIIYEAPLAPSQSLYSGHSIRQPGELWCGL